MGSRARTTLLACLALLAVAPAAHASEAYLDEDTGVATAQGDPGEANVMQIRPGGDGVIFSDTVGIHPRPGSGCRALSENEVTCPGDGGLLLGADGDDDLRDGGLTTSFGARGGPGDDTIVAGAVDALLYGDDPKVRETDGDDRITGSRSTRPLDPAHPDFHDFIAGGGGDDNIAGLEGNDELAGQGGTDTIDGGEGDDNLEGITLLTVDERDAPGDEGDDFLAGGAGNDAITANRGRDVVDGNDGNDRVFAVDNDLGRDDLNSDTVRCGTGADTVDAGAGDKLQVGCETLRVALYCKGCTAKGAVTGRAKGAKKTTTVAKINKAIATSYTAELPLKKATKLLGTRKKTTLTFDVTMRRGKTVVGGRVFVFTLLAP